MRIVLPTRWRIPCLIAILVLTPRVAFGQEPIGSFSQLKGLTGAGDRVTVIDTAGVAASGAVIRITDDELAVDVQGSRRTWTPSQLRQVRRRTADAVLNGALIGGAVGVGVGSLSYLDNECREKPGCAKALLMGTATFAGVGALIDAFIHGERVIYQAPAGSSSPAVGLTFVGGKGRAALQFDVRF